MADAFHNKQLSKLCKKNMKRSIDCWINGDNLRDKFLNSVWFYVWLISLDDKLMRLIISKSRVIVHNYVIPYILGRFSFLFNFFFARLNVRSNNLSLYIFKFYLFIYLFGGGGLASQLFNNFLKKIINFVFFKMFISKYKFQKFR